MKMEDGGGIWFWEVLVAVERKLKFQVSSLRFSERSRAVGSVEAAFNGEDVFAVAAFVMRDIHELFHEVNAQSADGTFFEWNRGVHLGPGERVVSRGVVGNDSADTRGRAGEDDGEVMRVSVGVTVIDDVRDEFLERELERENVFHRRLKGLAKAFNGFGEARDFGEVVGECELEG